ncbi:hypothetical protein GALMADRAFT_225641 [Galerina marginata CBS 339.88]|uniref:Uncharacterized protein n=1 Tax=Galerina marginata (strain CBS 339.88) TaxID=685588 RepID=A0A067T0G8_GALM3|nr:hypothetical protein GALMADRAFT_225641 [Galerina marginata CBS 339.88]
MAEAMQTDDKKAEGSGSASTGAVLAPAMTTDTAAQKETEKVIRINNHGKMKSWITNALAFFEDLDPSKSVTFHTLPLVASTTVPLHPPNQGGKQNSDSKSASNSNSTLTIPRLISIAEILKREFSKHLQATRSTRLEGLHQYNEIGKLEDLGLPVAANSEAQDQGQDAEQARRLQGILLALSGRNHPRQTQTPFMRITFSLSERPDLVERGATYQPPTERKLSKSGKQRAKKRAKKEHPAPEANTEATFLANATADVEARLKSTEKTDDSSDTKGGPNPHSNLSQGQRPARSGSETRGKRKRQGEDEPASNSKPKPRAKTQT